MLHAAPGPRPTCANRVQRALLLGNAQTLVQLYQATTLADPPLAVTGCVLAGRLPAAPNVLVPLPICGSLDDLPRLVKEQRPDLVLVSLPLASRNDLRRSTEVCETMGVAWRFLPALADQIAGRFEWRGLPAGREAATLQVQASTRIDPLLLINRTPRPLDEAAIATCLRGKTVLITGAGGSIGSELARIVGRFEPGKLVLVERGENALFEIDREIARRFPDLPRAAELHDVTNAPATMGLAMRHRPNVVFHAAAHKHVPMMEDHPGQAVENNFFGTRSIADAAAACGAERFVMISTDKAVNPSSVMGATKRLAELYIQHLNTQRSEQRPTVFSMVRFGNVLGSACSVLPIWTEQLGRGGPVTVTHPQMSRYFMTIPEAAGLVLQAAAFSGRDLDSDAAAGSWRSPSGLLGGEVFLLDMGEPIRIVDLAERFIRMHGYQPGVDVQIEFTGIRPGEKLFESLAYDGEDMLPTPHQSIHIWKSDAPDAARMRQIVATFERLRDKGGDAAHPWASATRDSIHTALRSALPEMVTAAAG